MTKFDLASIQGLNLVEDIYISDYELERRSWFERLFTKPWRPLLKYRSVYRPAMYIESDCSVRVSPQTKTLIMKILLDNADKNVSIKTGKDI